MNKDYTHITLVLDRSGSMASCWTDTMGGLKTLITDNKKEKNKCTFSFYNFDTVIEKTLDFQNLQLVSENVEDFGISPRGSTALYDAIGRAITETGDALRKLPESERPGRVIFVVQTDGQENASKEFRSNQIKTMVEDQTTKYDWQFMFIGADQNSVLSATRDLGFDLGKTTFYKTDNTCDTFEIMNNKLRTMRTTDYATYACAATFSAEEKSIMEK